MSPTMMLSRVLLVFSFLTYTIAFSTAASLFSSSNGPFKTSFQGDGVNIGRSLASLPMHEDTTVKFIYTPQIQYGIPVTAHTEILPEYGVLYYKLVPEASYKTNCTHELLPTLQDIQDTEQFTEALRQIENFICPSIEEKMSACKAKFYTFKIHDSNQKPLVMELYNKSNCRLAYNLEVSKDDSLENVHNHNICAHFFTSRVPKKDALKYVSKDIIVSNYRVITWC